MRSFLMALAVLLTACDTEPRAFSPVRAEAPLALPGLETSEAVAAEHPTFDRYWYRGKAELNRYEVQQSRYGALHPAEAVLIFVTEDFLKTKQVKFEGKGDAKDAVSVLKLNSYRRFYTGIYPYTLMTSVFSQAKRPKEAPLKLTFTATEWCGQSFMQLNRRANQFQIEERSYFEGEGDSESMLPVTLVEDALWTRIRQDPGSLPLGRIELLPAAQHVRLDHVPLKPMAAQASLSPEQQGKRTYHLKYDSGRELWLTFETRFPHRITRFEETPKRGAPTTRATLTRSIMLPYWEKNGPDDGAYRKALGLTL
jgi:hypothetical protein